MEVINAIGRRYWQDYDQQERYRGLFPFSYPAVCGKAATEPA